MTEICLITATYKQDFERFKILRKSIKKYAPQYHHITVVHKEDFNLFKKEFSNEKSFTLLSTSDVLPRNIELRREKNYDKKIPLNLKRRILDPYISGWHCQQLTKIAALATCNHEAAAFLDSDLFLCQPLPDDFFGTKGNSKIFRSLAENAEQIDYYISTYELLNQKLNEENKFFDYIFAPACFRKTTAIKLLEHSNNFSKKEWIRAFSTEKRPSEYNLLGFVAEKYEKFSGYTLIETKKDDLHYSIRYASDIKNLKSLLFEARTCPSKPFCLIQSNLNLECTDY